MNKQTGAINLIPSTAHTGRNNKTQEYSLHSEKKGYQNGAPGVLLLQMVPFFQRGTLFSLVIMFVEKGVSLQDRGTIHRNTGLPRSMPKQYPFLRGVLFRSKKKVENSSPLKKGTILIVPLWALFP